MNAARFEVRSVRVGGLVLEGGFHEFTSARDYAGELVREYGGQAVIVDRHLTEGDPADDGVVWRT